MLIRVFHGIQNRTNDEVLQTDAIPWYLPKLSRVYLWNTCFHEAVSLQFAAARTTQKLTVPMQINAHLLVLATQCLLPLANLHMQPAPASWSSSLPGARLLAICHPSIELQASALQVETAGKHEVCTF